MLKFVPRRLRNGIVRYGYLEYEDYNHEVHKIPLTEEDIDRIIEKLTELKEIMKTFHSIECSDPNLGDLLKKRKQELK